MLNKFATYFASAKSLLYNMNVCVW